MSDTPINKNELLRYLIKKSIFTERQISIIYNRKKGYKNRIGSKGAYYRVLQQSKNNIKRVFYSIILLEIFDIIDDEKINVLNRLSRQINISSDVSDINVRDVIEIINEVMKRLSRV